MSINDGSPTLRVDDHTLRKVRKETKALERPTSKRQLHEFPPTECLLSRLL